MSAEIKKERMVEQDIGKGLVMLYVILIHCVPMTDTADVFVRACLGFANPFLFLIAGYNHKTNTTITYGQRIKKRARQLLLPLLIYSLVVFAILFALMTMIGGEYGALDISKAYAGLWLTEPLSTMLDFPSINTFVGVQRAFEPYWFILYMFASFVIFYAVEKFALKDKRNFIAVNVTLIFVSMVLNYLGILLPWGFHNAPAFTSLLLVGAASSRHKLFGTQFGSNTKIHFYNTIISFVIVTFLALILGRSGQITGSGQITKILGSIEIPYTIFYAFIASFFLINISGYLKKTPCLGRFLAFLGRNSLDILLIHLIYMFIAKIIVGADLNANLATVTYIDWKNIIAFGITVVIVSIHCLICQTVRKNRCAKKQLKAGNS